MTERLVLVSSGGLGLEVNRALRAASLPGAGLFLSATADATRRAWDVAGRVLGATHAPSKPGFDELVHSYASLADADRRSAFLATVRSVVGLNGQTVVPGIVSISRRIFLSCYLGVRGSDHPGRACPLCARICCPTARSQFSTTSVISPRRGPRGSSRRSRTSSRRPSPRSSTRSAGVDACVSRQRLTEPRRAQTSFTKAEQQRLDPVGSAPGRAPAVRSRRKCPALVAGAGGGSARRADRGGGRGQGGESQPQQRDDRATAGPDLRSGTSFRRPTAVTFPRTAPHRRWSHTVMEITM